MEEKTFSETEETIYKFIKQDAIQNPDSPPGVIVRIPSSDVVVDQEEVKEAVERTGSKEAAERTDSSSSLSLVHPLGLGRQRNFLGVPG